jgi:creatinine amidohydrolase
VYGTRKSRVGGMGHGCEFETSFQLATRPELVKMDRLEGVYAPLVGWDLVAPVTPSRTYARRPTPETNHASIFGDPHCASAESGHAFIAAVVDGLVAMLKNLQGSYQERRPEKPSAPRPTRPARARAAAARVRPAAARVRKRRRP